MGIRGGGGGGGGGGEGASVLSDFLKLVDDRRD